MFRDREEAGRMLADALEGLELPEPVVLALPRGGVPVAAQVAARLGAPLDVVIVRKVGAPGNPELAAAAIVDGNPPDVVLNREIVEAYGLGDDALSVLVAAERPELERRSAVFRRRRHAASVRGRTVILVDDGAATGTTMKVAARAIRRRGPAQIVIALPVASTDAIKDLEPEADQIVCLAQPPRFRALGYHYSDFHQLDDAEVLSLVDDAARRRRAASGLPDPKADAPGAS